MSLAIIIGNNSGRQGQWVYHAATECGVKAGVKGVRHTGKKVGQESVQMLGRQASRPAVGSQNVAER